MHPTPAAPPRNFGDIPTEKVCLHCQKPVQQTKGRGRPRQLHTRCRTQHRSRQRAEQRRNKKRLEQQSLHAGLPKPGIARRSGIVPSNQSALVPPGSFVILPKTATAELFQALEALRKELELRLDSDVTPLTEGQIEQLVSYPDWGDELFRLLVATETKTF